MTHLTARETQVLRLVAEGHVNHAIGSVLHLSEDTVKSHLVHIFRKLKTSGRAHAVARGFEIGILWSESVPEDELTERWLEGRLAEARSEALAAERASRRELRVPWATGAGSRALWRLAELHRQEFRELVAEEMAQDEAEQGRAA